MCILKARPVRHHGSESHDEVTGHCQVMTLSPMCRQHRPGLVQHSSSCCGSAAAAQEAGEGEGAPNNAVQAALRWAFAKTGLQAVAEALDDNWAVSVTIVILYLASFAAGFASGDALASNNITD